MKNTAPLRVKRRSFLVSRFRKWLFRLVTEQQALEDDAGSWQRDTFACVFCQRPILIDSLFCRHCGFALASSKQETTGKQVLVKALPTTQQQPPHQPHVLTGQIEAHIRPKEEFPRMRAYHRLLKESK